MLNWYVVSKAGNLCYGPMIECYKAALKKLNGNNFWMMLKHSNRKILNWLCGIFYEIRNIEVTYKKILKAEFLKQLQKLTN